MLLLDINVPVYLYAQGRMGKFTAYAVCAPRTAGRGSNMEQKERFYVAVCDDEQYVHDIVQKMMDVYAEENNICCELHHIFSAQELLSFEETIDCLFLDIDMPEMDGIEAAYLLNKQGRDYKIIMLTSKAERFKDAFKIGAFRFVTKPISQNELFEAVDEVREHMMGSGKVPVYRDGVIYEIVRKDILYLMADGNTVRIFTESAEYRSERPLKQWFEELLDQRMFFACHRSYIVNLGKIMKIEKDMAVMPTGEKVPVARRSRRELQKEYMMYDTGRR